MAKEDPEERPMIDLYDSATGELLSTLKVVDITEDCLAVKMRNGKVVLIFAKAHRGRIVQIAEIDLGTKIHFFVDELSRELREPHRNNTFVETAQRLGLDMVQLRSIIEQHAPVA